jgi:hypothetical protein
MALSLGGITASRLPSRGAVTPVPIDVQPTLNNTTTKKIILTEVLFAIEYMPHRGYAPRLRPIPIGSTIFFPESIWRYAQEHLPSFQAQTQPSPDPPSAETLNTLSGEKSSSLSS